MALGDAHLGTKSWEKKFPLGCRGGHAHLLTPAAALIGQGCTSQMVHSMPCPLTFPEFICFNKQMRLLAEQ